MFFEALQSYYAPLVTLFIFVILVYVDQMYSKKIKRLFLLESAVILAIIIATWADRCLSVMELGGWAWKLRTVTTFINFALSPLSPAILVEIYRKSEKNKFAGLLYLPELLNLVCCIASLWNGCIFTVSAANTYTRGMLFFIPFTVSAFYMLALVFYCFKENTTPNRNAETMLLLVIMGVIAVATLLEVIFVKRFMIWSTTEICVILYYMELNIQKIVYDGLTGTFSRTAYTKQMELIDGRKSCALAMIDLNGLKYYNDNYGHTAGDKALCTVSDTILKNKTRSMRLYRYGGDEFVLLGINHTCSELERVLENALRDCGEIGGVPITFAYGTAAYTPELELSEVTASADEKMYAMKSKMKLHR